MNDIVMDLIDQFDDGNCFRPATGRRRHFCCSCPYNEYMNRRIHSCECQQSPHERDWDVLYHHKAKKKEKSSDSSHSCGRRDSDYSDGLEKGKKTSQVPNTDKTSSNTTTTKNNSNSTTSSVQQHPHSPQDTTPWLFNVEVKDYDKVRATTESGMLIIDGERKCKDSRVMFRQVTSLPRHVNPDSLTATLKEGQLKVSERPNPQVTQGRVLPIVHHCRGGGCKCHN